MKTKKLLQSITVLILLIGFPIATNATGSYTCEPEKQNGNSCYYTKLLSVTDNGGSYTIVFQVRSTGGSGSTCKELSHFTVGKKYSPYTYSNVSVQTISGNFNYSDIEYGDWSNKKDKLKGFKLDGTSNIGDGEAGVFNITFTVNSLHNIQTLAKFGQEYAYATFYTSEFLYQLNNCGSDPECDITVVKNVDKATAFAGEQLVYTITVTNNGPDLAENVSMEDLFPNTLTVGTPTVSTGTWSAPDWNIGNLANGASATFSVTATIANNATGTITNTATVETTTDETNYNNNEDDAETTILTPQVDITVVKDVDKASASPGEQIEYTITVTNNGPHLAQNVVMNDVFPATLTVGTPNVSKGSWSAPNWTIGNMLNGESETMTVTATIKNSATGTITNTSTVSTSTNETNYNNNSDDASTTITPKCDITVVKDVDKTNVDPGGQIEYTITVTNNGPSLAENVNMEDVFPNTLTVGTPTLSTGSWSAPDWTIGNLANGASATFTVTATVADNAEGVITNTAVVTTTTTETDYTNNDDDASTTVNIVSTPECDIKVDKTVDKASATPGSQIIYTIVVTNDGPSDAENVFMKDTIPNSLTVNSTNPNIGTSDKLNWDIGTLTNGESKTLTVTATIGNGFTGNITNTAYVVTSTQETDYTNNDDDASTIVEDTPNLENFQLGTLAYEDLWPGKGDYDFNDLVLNYDFRMITNPSNYLIRMECEFIIEAFGAGYENGFGFQLSDAIDQNLITVTGYELTENYVTLNQNGTEQGQSKATIIVYDNAYNQMQHPGSGIGVNTDPPAPYVTPDTINMLITFPADTYTLADLDIVNFNPFIIVDQNRGHEVHLPDYPPTDLVNQSLFATFEDDSNPGQGRYYKTENNLPWAIHIFDNNVTFDYPTEKTEISSAHLHFIEWAQSSGTQFEDWYLDKPGYRNDANIY